VDYDLPGNKNPQTLEQAFEFSRKAISLDDSLSPAHTLLAAVYRNKGQYEQAISQAERALSLNPSEANANLIMGSILSHVGRSEEAIEMVEKAMQLNPAIPAWYLTTFGVAYRLSGRLTEAVLTLKRVFDHPPSHENALNAHLSLAILYVELGQEEDARAEAEKILKLSPIFSVEVWGQRNPNKDQAQIERDKAALRKAGLE
jgi:adenylate cyclase